MRISKITRFLPFETALLQVLCSESLQFHDFQTNALLKKVRFFFKSSWKTEWSRLFSNEIQNKVVSGHITGVRKWWWHCCFSNLLATSRVLRRQNSSFVDISPTMMPIWSSVWWNQYKPLTSLCAWNWHLLPNVGIIWVFLSAMLRSLTAHLQHRSYDVQNLHMKTDSTC